MPRTMTQSQEAALRYTARNLPYSASNSLVSELDAEREVSKALARALSRARLELHPNDDWEAIKESDAALALYRESKP